MWSSVFQVHAPAWRLTVRRVPGWAAASALARRWWRRRSQVRVPPVSAEWLRAHETETSKHRDAP
jgi:hypothetical protein